MRHVKELSTLFCMRHGLYDSDTSCCNNGLKVEGTVGSTVSCYLCKAPAARHKRIGLCDYSHIAVRLYRLQLLSGSWAADGNKNNNSYCNPQLYRLAAAPCTACVMPIMLHCV